MLGIGHQYAFNHNIPRTGSDPIADIVMKNFIGWLAFTCIALTHTAQAEGDIDAGRELSTQCSACHGTYGLSSSEQFPNIAGQKESYLRTQLEKFQSGQRDDLTMQAIVGPLSDQNIQDLAAYFASNSSVATFFSATSTLLIPYVNVANDMYQVEMLLTSPENLSFSVTNIENR